MFVRIVMTVFWYHSLPDPWKSASIDEVLEIIGRGLLYKLII